MFQMQHVSCQSDESPATGASDESPDAGASDESQESDDKLQAQVWVSPTVMLWCIITYVTILHNVAVVFLLSSASSSPPSRGFEGLPLDWGRLAAHLSFHEVFLKQNAQLILIELYIQMMFYDMGCWEAISRRASQHPLSLARSFPK